MNIQEPSPEESGNDGDIPQLSFEEARVLGCLLEKEMTTPEYYPMTLNSLVAACNQKSNRNPVSELDEATVEDGIAGLRRHKLAVMVSMSGSRVPKFKHTIDYDCGSLDRAQLAILSVLLLRGPQTVGELRTRTERMHRFDELNEVEEVLESLIERTYGNLVKMLPPGGGRKAKTFTHLFCGDVEPVSSAYASAPVTVAAASSGWRDEMTAQIETLRAEVAALRQELDAFRQQFS
ncbi:MAG: YceH family protein [Verrucomicrobiae bacterium]|nr:YceH family protein [Verrucomicrobiae bacterium]